MCLRTAFTCFFLLFCRSSICLIGKTELLHAERHHNDAGDAGDACS